MYIVDVIVLQITQHGGIACHTGRESCFYRVLTPQGWQVVDAVQKDPQAIYGGSKSQHDSSHSHAIATEQQLIQRESVDVLAHLAGVMQQRKQASEDKSYVASLYGKGLNKILEKVGEESIETILAAKDCAIHLNAQEYQDELIYETADLWFHSIVMLGYFDLAPKRVLDELARRMGLSGLDEKAARSSS